MATTHDVALDALFDADNHYWEPKDAFTRHRDPELAERGLEIKEVDGALRYVIEGEVFQMLPGPRIVYDNARELTLP